MGVWHCVVAAALTAASSTSPRVYSPTWPSDPGMIQNREALVRQWRQKGPVAIQSMIGVACSGVGSAAKDKRSIPFLLRQDLDLVHAAEDELARQGVAAVAPLLAYLRTEGTSGCGHHPASALAASLNSHSHLLARVLCGLRDDAPGAARAYQSLAEALRPKDAKGALLQEGVLAALEEWKLRKDSCVPPQGLARVILSPTRPLAETGLTLLAIGGLGPGAASLSKELVALLDDPKPRSDRPDIVRVLGRLGEVGEHTLEGIRSLLKRAEPGEQKDLLDAIATLGPGAKPLLPALIALAQAEVDAFQGTKASGPPSRNDRILEDLSSLVPLLAALGAANAPDALPPLKKALEVVRFPSPSTRRMILGIGQLGPAARELAGELRQVLANERLNFDAREAAADALDCIGAPWSAKDAALLTPKEVEPCTLERIRPEGCGRRYTPLPGNPARVSPCLVIQCRYPRLTLGQVSTTGSVDRTSADTLVSWRAFQLRECYLRALEAEPALAGVSEVGLSLDEGAGVQSAKVTGTQSQDLNRCLEDRLRSWKFAPAQGIGPSKVDFTVTWEPSAIYDGSPE
ncbi:MAG: hypothetical protein HY901_01385 [Deltaproteobacteria bacterium]|nr:hypothetical protein [Deltaproteobacteria bacterium]